MKTLAEIAGGVLFLALVAGLMAGLHVLPDGAQVQRQMEAPR